MSKGPGRVQREIDSILASNLDDSFTVEELCQRVYEHSRIQKRHRVAVIRAAKAVIKWHPNVVCWRSENRGRTLVFFNHRSVMAYATSRLKTDAIGGPPPSDAAARRSLHEDERYSNLIKKGGAWWFHVQEWIAVHDLDTARLEELKPIEEELAEESKQRLAALAGVLSNR